ncbi:hypothetical protein Gpo141_00005485 [Globisporangium polare]
MKSFTAFALVLLAAVAASTTSAAEQASHIRVRVHSGTHQKFYVTPMGKQCAYNASIDPSMYPCRDGGICVRKNETFGICELPSSESDSGSDDSDSVELSSDGSSSDESDDSESSVDEEEYEDEDEDDSFDNTAQ